MMEYIILKLNTDYTHYTYYKAQGLSSEKRNLTDETIYR